MDLIVDEVWAGYGRATICRGTSLQVRSGEIVTVLGRNGAGKSTLLRTISGLVELRSGRVIAANRDLIRMNPKRRLKLGIVRVPQDNSVFPNMRLDDNLLLGGYVFGGKEAHRRMREVLEDFPTLAARLYQLAGTLSGGQQRLLVIARALVAGPKVLLLDEPCTGLAPAMREEIGGLMDRLAATGLTMFVAEQNVSWALQYSDRLVVMDRGVIRTSRGGGRNAGRDVSAQDLIEELRMEVPAGSSTTIARPGRNGPWGGND